MAAEGSKKKAQVILLTGFGGYDKLKIVEVERDAPREEEVQIRVKATGLNFAEITARQGLYGDCPRPPCVLGYEGSGVVEEVGSKVTSLKVGDRVMCMNKFGMWTDLINIAQTGAIKIPENMTFEEAAAIPVNYVTAYFLLFEFGNVRPGKSVLIHMAAGGVGWAVTQLCKSVGDVTVFGTASAHKHDIIRKNGCDYPIDYHTKDYVTEVRKISPKGVDIVLDPLFGQDAVKGYNLLKPLGKVVHFGAANMVKGESRNLLDVAKTWWHASKVSLIDLMMKNRGVCGLNAGRLHEEVELLNTTMKTLVSLYEQGKIKPHVDSVWAYKDVGQAQAHIHNRKNVGKVILTPDGPSQQTKQQENQANP